MPDVIISRTPDKEFEVEVVESKRFNLNINPIYITMAAELRRDGARLTEAERRHCTPISRGPGSSFQISRSATGRCNTSRPRLLRHNASSWWTVRAT
jgi:hypothetical protein